ncbi:helix-turn-helix domain-containing protein [Hoeflea sp. AS16]|uniref:IclR family transcriptional regulator n=1 Tax=unclassified Hoeflea TaxID=2614931 RepID=UPI003174FB5E
MQSSQVKSATRAIEILELFKRIRQPRAMSEIAQALNYPQSSTTVLLKTLVTLGYLHFDRRERLYFPTPKVAALGDWVPRALFGNSRVLDAMRDVHAATGESVAINIKNDVYVQYVQVLQSVHALRFHVEEGTVRPLTQTGLGWTLMSTMTDEKIDNIVRRANLATEKSKRVTISDMMEKVREIRAKGYGFAENIPFPGGATLCLVLPVTIHGQAAVLGLGGAAGRIRQNHDRYLSILRHAVSSVQPSDLIEQPGDQTIDIGS